MNITFVTPEFVTENKNAGLATYLSNISTILANQRHKVTIVTLSETDNSSFQWKPNIFVERVFYKNKFIYKLLKKFRCYIGDGLFDEEVMDVLEMLCCSLLLNLRVKKKQNKSDIIQYSNFRAVGFYRNRKIPCIVRISSDNTLWRYAYYSAFNINKSINNLNLFDKFELKSVEKADKIYSPSILCANIFKKRLKRKIEVIESPFVDFTDTLDDSIYMDKLSGTKYFLFHGTLGYLKGVHNIAACIYEILHNNLDLNFVFAGRDEKILDKNGRLDFASSVIKRNSKEHCDRIHYLGIIPRKQLYPIIASSQACILPSRVDNLPNACIEAMAMGKIVVGTYGASFEQLIEQGKSGLLIKRDSPQSLLKAMNYILNMKNNEVENMGNYAKQRVTQMDCEDIYKQTLNLYEETIRKFNHK